MILKPGETIEVQTPVGIIILSAEAEADKDDYGCHTIISWQRDKRIDPIDINGHYVVLGRKPRG